MQCNRVNDAFAQQLEVLEDAKHKLEHHLKKVRGPFAMAQSGRSFLDWSTPNISTGFGGAVA